MSPLKSRSRERCSRIAAWAKRLAAVCCALVLLLAVRCSSRPEQEANRIVFRHGKMFGQATVLKEILAEFEARNPGVTVAAEELPSSSDEQHQFYVINLEGRSSDIDVLTLDVVWVPEFARADWLRPLDRLLDAEELADLFPGPRESVTYRGKIYAVPWYVDAGLLYYRRDLLQRFGFAPPQTWGELATIAKAIRRELPELHGYVWQGKEYEGLVCNVLELLWSAGGGVLDGSELDVASAENLQALTFLQELIFKDEVTPRTVSTFTEEPSRYVFQRGDALFMRNWPYAWSLLTAPGSPVRDKVGVSVLPSFPGQEPAATLGGWQLAVSRFSRRPELAEKLVSYLTSPEVQKKLALAGGFHPSRRSLYSDPELLAVHPRLATLKEIFEHAHPRPLTPYYPALSQILQREFSALVVGLKSPEHVVESLQTQISFLLGLEEAER